MDLFESMQVFRRVAELKSFSGAARELRLSNASVTNHIASLERHLRSQLLRRTTRSVALTDEGSAYYPRCVRILEDVTEAEQAARQDQLAPRGQLRVSCSASFGILVISRLVPDFLARWPELSLDLSFDDRIVDLFEEGVDVAVRIATKLADSSSLTAQRLVQSPEFVCAAPSYLKEHGTPTTPRDLAKHNCILHGLDPRKEWVFQGPRGEERVEVSGNLRFNSSLAMRDAVLNGVGLALLTPYQIERHSFERRLKKLLPRYRLPTLSAYAVYPRQRHLSAKIRVWVDFLRERLAKEPWAV